MVWENSRQHRTFSLKLIGKSSIPRVVVHPRSSIRSLAAERIPLEAQRLGLRAFASDLNPVAVLIQKALIEIPPKFRDQEAHLSGTGRLADPHLDERRRTCG